MYSNSPLLMTMRVQYHIWSRHLQSCFQCRCFLLGCPDVMPKDARIRLWYVCLYIYIYHIYISYIYLCIYDMHIYMCVYVCVLHNVIHVSILSRTIQTVICEEGILCQLGYEFAELFTWRLRYKRFARESSEYSQDQKVFGRFGTEKCSLAHWCERREQGQRHEKHHNLTPIGGWSGGDLYPRPKAPILRRLPLTACSRFKDEVDSQSLTPNTWVSRCSLETWIFRWLIFFAMLPHTPASNKNKSLDTSCNSTWLATSCNLWYLWMSIPCRRRTLRSHRLVIGSLGWFSSLKVSHPQSETFSLHQLWHVQCWVSHCSPTFPSIAFKTWGYDGIRTSLQEHNNWELFVRLCTTGVWLGMLRSLFAVSHHQATRA